jgi:acetoin utilization deacetylase AcuC-like enzyme
MRWQCNNTLDAVSDEYEDSLFRKMFRLWHMAHRGPPKSENAHDILAEKGYSFVTPTVATEDEALSVHDMEYLWNLKKGLVEDGDTPAYDNIIEIALLSAGAAITASKIGGFSLTRPPGHHCGRYGAALGVYTRGFAI